MAIERKTNRKLRLDCSRETRIIVYILVLGLKSIQPVTISA